MFEQNSQSCESLLDDCYLVMKDKDCAGFYYRYWVLEAKIRSKQVHQTEDSWTYSLSRLKALTGTENSPLHLLAWRLKCQDLDTQSQGLEIFIAISYDLLTCVNLCRKDFVDWNLLFMEDTSLIYSPYFYFVFNCFVSKFWTTLSQKIFLRLWMQVS